MSDFDPELKPEFSLDGYTDRVWAQVRRPVRIKMLELYARWLVQNTNYAPDKDMANKALAFENPTFPIPEVKTKGKKTARQIKLEKWLDSLPPL
jgi:hypothetical protein